MTAPETDAPLLQVDDLVVQFAARGGLFRRAGAATRAVDGVSLRIAPGQTLGLVGESGCGKTTVGRAVLRLVPITSGRVRFEGRDVASLRGNELKNFRKRAQIVFQDPAGSLNPRLRVETIVGEPLEVHRLVSSREARRARVIELLEQCGLPKDAVDRFPHEFSGGQRQRIGIARALALEPRLIVCDEPTSALDVSIQAQILNLLADLRDTHRLSYLFISHDMAVIHHICDRVAVMQAGRIVEEGPREAVLGAPRHAYTQALLSAVPTPVVKPRRAAAPAATVRA